MGSKNRESTLVLLSHQDMETSFTLNCSNQYPTSPGKASSHTANFIYLFYDKYFDCTKDAFVAIPLQGYFLFFLRVEVGDKIP